MCLNFPSFFSQPFLSPEVWQAVLARPSFFCTQHIPTSKILLKRKNLHVIKCLGKWLLLNTLEAAIHSATIQNNITCAVLLLKSPSYFCCIEGPMKSNIKCSRHWLVNGCLSTTEPRSISKSTDRLVALKALKNGKYRAKYVRIGGVEDNPSATLCQTHLKLTRVVHSFHQGHWIITAESFYLFFTFFHVLPSK